jgi:hypothetical protein
VPYSIENSNGGRVERISPCPRDFVVLDPSQFIVLNPQIGLDLFESIQEPENCDVAFRDIAIFLLVLTESG